jgi:hypothetical protein
LADIAFPAHLVVTEEVDDNGLPILTAVVDPADNFADDSLPAGNPGPPGPRGVPGPTFVKMGEIADEAARPTGLTAEDRGKWWHRFDTNGMDVWDGSAWVPSPDAVGPQGPVADANTLTVTTVHDPAITLAAADISGTGAAQALTVTAPAGLRGAAGPAGGSGAIATASDFDASTAPTLRSTFGLSAGGNRWLIQNPPNGFGPWSWYSTDFDTGSTSITADTYVMGTFTIPALPFRWRPLTYGHIHAGAAPGTGTYPVAYVRLGSTHGVTVAAGAGARYNANITQLRALIPTYGDEGTKSLSPASEYATVPANELGTLVVVIAREGNANTWAASNEDASLTVWAIPV